MVQYYTLDQAAQILHISADKLKELVKTGKVRAFQDRGTLRFRTQEIDEMARAQGLGSDTNLPVPESGRGNTGAPTSSARRKSKIAPPGDSSSSDFEFKLAPEDSQAVPLGGAPPSKGGSSSSKNKAPSSRQGPRTSDSDVRLVGDGSDMDFDLSLDAFPPKSPTPARKSRLAPGGKKDSDKRLSGGGKKDSKLVPPGSKSDSDIRLVPPPKPGSDSDVKIVPDDKEEDSEVPLGQSRSKLPSDSDIRLEADDGLPGLGLPKRPGSDPLITEEIDLDLEEMRAEQAQAKKKPTPKAGGTVNLPTSSPFELSESDIDVSPAPPAKDKDLDESSSDFDLTPLGDSSGSNEMPAVKADDDEVSLGEVSGAAGASGINLQDPADSGISLEADGSDEMEFELTLDDSSMGSVPAVKKKDDVDSDSEFELTLDDDSSSPEMAGKDDSDSDSDSGSDSEFELTLDDDSAAPDMLAKDADSGSESDSEFELTLDEEGGLAPLDEESSSLEEDDKDLFEESDFEVPSLEDESGSEAVALEDSGSDFDLALDDSVVTEGDSSDSESQVVGLEEDEEADEASETVARPAKKSKSKKAAVADLEDEEGLDLDLESGPEDEGDEDLLEDDLDSAGRVREVPVEAAPAEWGVLPTLFMLPCVIVLFVVGLMGFELVQGMWSYQKGTKPSSLIIDPLARMFDDTLPKE